MMLSRTTRITLLLLWLMFLVGLASFGGQAQAHNGGFPFKYVAMTGVDNGDCDSPALPCQTIQYALSTAVPGDQIRVASGVYYVGDMNLMLFLNDTIPIKGGYQTGLAGFALQDPSRNPTYLLGIDPQQQPLFADRGFVLATDLKSVRLPNTQDAQSSPLQQQALADPVTYTPCRAGAAASFPCHGIDLLARLPLQGFSSAPATANDIWGFVDLNDQHEYALIGLSNGTAVVDVTNPISPVEVGTVPGLSTIWRDIKVAQFFDANQNRWRAYAYVTADNVLQGLQIIDLSQLPSTITLAATYTGFSRAHNIYIGNVDYATGAPQPGLTPFAYIMGSNLDGGRFRVLDISNPVAPLEVTASPPGSGYAHDGSSFVITDSRTLDCAFEHNPCEIFIDFNETTVDLWDVTDKSAPLLLSKTSYDGVTFTHSGWPSADKMFIFVQDELDELASNENTRLRVLDISDLKVPFVSRQWSGPTRAIDHNGFTQRSHYYMSNYERGITVLNVANPNTLHEIAFFDTYPTSDLPTWGFQGAWGVYPYLPSGTILASDGSRGLFVLREQGLAIDNVGPDMVPFGTPITYTLTITNNGSLPATNMVITNYLPGDVDYVSGGVIVGDVVSWTIASLASGATTNTTLVVNPITITTVTNTHYGVSALGSVGSQIEVYVQGQNPVISRVYQEMKLFLPVILKACAC